MYRKPTLTEQYLAFNSHHPTSAKRSVIAALHHRAQHVISNDTLFDQEIQHITSALHTNSYPLPFIRNTIHRFDEHKQRSQQQQQQQNENHGFARIPFLDRTSQAIARILRKLNIRTIQFSQPWQWFLQHAVKDGTPIEDRKGIVYKITCHDCDRVYIGESGRTIRTRIKEHKAGARNGHPEVSAAAEHALLLDHQLAWDETAPLDQDNNKQRRRIKEALWIHRHRNTVMNRDTGLELSPLWLELVEPKPKP